MHKLVRLILATVLLSGCASLAAAGDLKLSMSNGRVTLIAQDVPLRQILDEWARVGKTTIVNGDKLNGPPMTLQLVDRPEREVLDLLLRTASGYIAAPRTASLDGASVFEKVMILPVSRGPVGVTASTPPTPFSNNRPAMNMAAPPPPDDDNPEPAQQVVMPPGMIVPNGPVQNPGQVLPPGQQPPITATRPGMLPAPPAGQPNPYAQPTVPGMQPQPQPTVPGIQAPVQAPVPGAIPPPFVRPPGGPGGPGGE